MPGESVLLSQFDGEVEYLKIKISTGDAQIFSAGEIDKDKVSFGMFECEQGVSGLSWVALLATPKGPLMFLNHMQLYPEADKTKIKIKDDDNESHFLVLHEGKAIFGLFYKKKFGIGLHPYNNAREDIDFYYWLSKNIDNPKLYQVYTREAKFFD